MGLTIRPPDINQSDADFTIINNQTMQYGLAAIKNIGYKAAENIVLHRKTNGPYTTIFQLCTIGHQNINKKVIESLILVGACNSLGEHRAKLFESLDIIIDFSAKFFKNKNQDQENLFGDSDASNIQFPQLKEVEIWNTDKTLKHEKELLGFYLTDNPLAKYEKEFIELSTVDRNRYNLFQSESINIGGIITSVNLRYDKNGNQWAILSLDTFAGAMQTYVFNKTYLEYIHLLQEDNIIFIKGRISNQSDNHQVTQIIANKIYTAENIKDRLTKYINIKFTHNTSDKIFLTDLSMLCKNYKGQNQLMLHMITSQSRDHKIIINKYLVNSSSEFLTKLRNIFGKRNVWLS